ncbi:hypothetical protein GSbR_09880 [Geobacter sp. SVR]|nr:hypothetical protein GSVR_13110 [Geobacter sp. SVR]GCF84388.1 hypothetical protein GSbR_09880 [Geobacter sp. SVR]
MVGEQLPVQDDQQIAETEKGEQYAQVGGKFQRFERERGNGIEGELQHFPERILGFSGKTFFPAEIHADLFEAEPAYDAADVAVSLLDGFERITHRPVDQAEIAGVDRDVHIGHLLHQAVEEGCAEFLEKGLTLPLPPFAVDDVIPLFPACDHLGNDLRRVLEIRIDYDHGLSLRIIHPCRYGGLMAEILGKFDDFYGAVASAQIVQDREGPVGTAVVDEDDLVGLVQFLHHGMQSLVHFDQDLFFVEDRHDNRKSYGFRHAHPRCCYPAPSDVPAG